MTHAYQPGMAQPPSVDAGRLWAGGAMTAVVAALIAVVGALLAHALPGIKVLMPMLTPDGWQQLTPTLYTLGAAIAGLVATTILHVLLLSAPQPMRFFGWLLALASAVAVIVPFLVPGNLRSHLFTAVLNLVIGIAIGSLLAGASRAARRGGRRR
jgi:hypothetical protein